jgi:uncharacterized damage-inducible protein DinB
LDVKPDLPEPWLRGPIAGVDPLIVPILYAFTQTREDLMRHTEGLTPDEIWARPHDLGSLGFHLRHIAGSTNRLMTYVEGKQLSETQIAAMKDEARPGASRDELLDEIAVAFQNAEAVVRALTPEKLREPREVGRKRLPTTVIGLLTHIAEHTQRHVGQAISAAKLARARKEEAAERIS